MLRRVLGRVGQKYRWRQLNAPQDFDTDTRLFICACQCYWIREVRRPWKAKEFRP